MSWFKCAGIALLTSLLIPSANATPLTFWNNDGWKQLSYDSKSGNEDYLFYKIEGATLHMGLQSDFDLVKGENSTKHPGDMALSFDGVGTGYEYGIDSCQLIQDCKSDHEGLYKMDDGTKDRDLLDNKSGWDMNDGKTKYFRDISFDLKDHELKDFDKHIKGEWSSCDNKHDVPEPATLSLLGLGLVGIGMLRRRKK